MEDNKIWHSKDELPIVGKRVIENDNNPKCDVPMIYTFQSYMNIESDWLYYDELISLADRAEKYKDALKLIQNCIKNGSDLTRFMDIVMINEFIKTELGDENAKE